MNPDSQEVMGKVHMLEEVMSSFMEQQKKQMEKLTNEVASVRAVGSKPPGLQIPIVEVLDSPAKKRKHDEAQDNVRQSYAGATLAGVKPLGQQNQNSIRMLQNLMQQQNSQPRQQKNICFGTAKTSGDNEKETLLAADVDLVATGVMKDCTNEDLKEFLRNKGIGAVSVETLTRDEVLPNVRTKTFKITVKAAQYEMALKPDVWPYRVAVRHYRAPKRTESTWGNQSGKTGGIVDKSVGVAGQAGGLVNGQQPGSNGRGIPGGAISDSGSYGGARSRNVHTPSGLHSRFRSSQQHFPDPLQLSNLFGILGQLGSLESPSH